MQAFSLFDMIETMLFRGTPNHAMLILLCLYIENGKPLGDTVSGFTRWIRSSDLASTSLKDEVETLALQFGEETNITVLMQECAKGLRKKVEGHGEES